MNTPTRNKKTIHNPKLMNDKIKKAFDSLYQNLFQTYGPQHWWPADSLLEMIVGAILTQNTAWSNVVTAIQQIKAENLLDFETLVNTNPEEIAPLIKCTGYFNIKSKRLHHFLNWLWVKTDGNLENLFQTPVDELRMELLAQEGIGPETADSILLYGGHKLVFVVDAYTKRIFTRHGLISGTETYEEIKNFSEKYLPPSVEVYQELHALIVKAGSEQCKTQPLCKDCPLEFWRASYINTNCN
jgi:endonuclease-3 related protein